MGVYSLRKQLLICSSALGPSFDVSVGIHLLHASFPNNPSTGTGGSYHFVLISGFLEEHAEAVEGHRLLDGAPGDELIGDLGGGHELAGAGSGDIEIDGEELLLVLLRTEVIVMCLQFIDVIEVEPILEVVLDEVLRLRVDLLVREGDIERVGDTLSLEGQPSAVAGDVGEELGFVAGRTERREPYPPLLGIAVRRPFGDIRGGDDGLHDVQFARTHGVYLVEGDESVLGDTQPLVFVEGGAVRHLTAVDTQFGRQEVFQTVPLLTRKANDTCHWLFLGCSRW